MASDGREQLSNRDSDGRETLADFGCSHSQALERRFRESASIEPEVPNTAHPELLSRLKKITLASCAKFWSDSKLTGRRTMLPAPKYKPELLGAHGVR